MARRKRKRENPLSARTIYGCDGHAMRNHVCMQCGRRGLRGNADQNRWIPLAVAECAGELFVRFVRFVRPSAPAPPTVKVSLVSSLFRVINPNGGSPRKAPLSVQRALRSYDCQCQPTACRATHSSLLPSLVLSPPHSERESSRRRWLQPSSPSSPPPPPPPPTPPSAQPSAPSPSADLGATAPWMRRRRWRPQVLTPCPLSPDRATG